jgi:hypothetical protein
MPKMCLYPVESVISFFWGSGFFGLPPRAPTRGSELLLDVRADGGVRYEHSGPVRQQCA